MFILHAVGTAIGFLFHLLATLCRIVYRILKALRIRLLALYLIVCGILQLSFRTFDGFAIAYFWVGVAACAAVTLYGWTSFVRERKRRRELSRRNREERENAQPTKNDGAQRQRTEEEHTARDLPAAPPVYPQYFEVEGHKGYMFAEYEDRYELFRREASGWTYIRTDYKEDKS